MKLPKFFAPPIVQNTLGDCLTGVQFNGGLLISAGILIFNKEVVSVWNLFVIESCGVNQIPFRKPVGFLIWNTSCAFRYK